MIRAVWPEAVLRRRTPKMRREAMKRRAVRTLPPRMALAHATVFLALPVWR